MIYNSKLRVGVNIRKLLTKGISLQMISNEPPVGNTEQKYPKLPCPYQCVILANNMDYLTPPPSPRLCECDSTCEKRRNKNKKQLVQSLGVIYIHFRQLADWNVTINVTVNVTVTLNREKGKCHDSNLFLNNILKWTIFSCAGDRLAKKMSLYVESQDYVEAYDVVWSVLTYSGISDRGDR